MSFDIEALRQAALQATPGPWIYLGSGTSLEEYRHKPGSSATYAKADGCSSLIVEHTAFGRQAVDDAAYIAAASPDVVLGLLDRLAAAEAVAETLERRVAYAGFDPLDIFKSNAGPAEHERQGYLDGLRTAARVLRTALDGPPADLPPSEALDDPECQEKPADDGSKP